MRSRQPRNQELQNDTVHAQQPGETGRERADTKPEQDKTSREDFSDHEHRAEDRPEDPEVVFHAFRVGLLPDSAVARL